MEGIEKTSHRIVVADAKKFTDALGVVSKLVNDVLFKFEQEGLKIIAMDQANCAMVDFTYKSSGFVEYSFKAPGQYGIDLGKLKPILDRAGSKDIITLEFDDQITITLKGKGVKKYTARIIADIEDKQKKVPDMIFSASIKLKSKELVEYVDDASVVADRIQLFAEKGRFGIGTSSELNTLSMDIIPTEIVVQSEKQVTSKYSIEYLNKLLEGKKISEDVTVRFGTDYPMKLEFKTDYIELNYVLAPFVSNE